MLPERTNFISLNEGFTCENCGEVVPKANKTCRNHCTKCLVSLHVDDKVPGDRKSGCLGLMIPKFIDLNRKKGYIIIHKCKKCGKISRNKVADDDDMDKVIEISKSLPKCQETTTKKRIKK